MYSLSLKKCSVLVGLALSIMGVCFNSSFAYAIDNSLATQQNGTICKGVVVDVNNQPVIGAAIIAKGTKLGTVTDINGAFTLKDVSMGDILEVSCIGYATMSVKYNGEKMRIVLQVDKKILDEVVVVAFGTATKAAFTGNATFIKSDELKKRVTTNVANALVGNVPGLQMRGASGSPGAGAGSINIQGFSSIYSSTAPLIIVDGAPYSGSLSNIPQNDIAEISVLKDAASAALYGARGASGVIIVTTKSGKSQGAVVNVDAKFGVNTRAIQDYDVIKNPAEYYEATFAEYYNYAKSPGLSEPIANPLEWANNKMLADLGYNVYTLPKGEFLVGENGKLNPNAKLGREFMGKDGLKYYLLPDDWQKVAYKSAIRQDYNVSISGRSGKSTYYTSFGYLDEGGIIPSSGYKRLSTRSKFSYEVKPWLRLGANFNYIHSKNVNSVGLGGSFGQENLFYYTSMIAPIYPVYVRTIGANGKPELAKDSEGRIRYDYGVSNSNGGLKRAFNSPGNPLGGNLYNRNFTERNNFENTYTLDVKITDWLKFNSSNTLIWQVSENTYYGSTFVLPKSSVGGELRKSVGKNYKTNFVQTLNFHKLFGDHDVSAMLGHEYYLSTYRNLNATAQGGFSPDILELDAFATKTDNGSNFDAYNVEGFFAQLQYNYKNKYFASASFRRDASSRFDPKHMWGNFWSIGGAYLLSSEDFMRDYTWVDMLKVKASIGQQGNDGVDTNADKNLYNITKSTATSMSPSFWRIGNPNITWETATNFNVGIEFGLFRGRLSGSLDVYNKRTSNLLFWLSVPESLGSRGYFGNIGDLRNRGVEFTLSAKPISTKMVDWTINFNISHNKTKILSLPKNKIADYGGFTEGSFWYKVGGELKNVLTYDYAGVDPETGRALYYYDEDFTNIKAEGTNPAGKASSVITNRPAKKRSGTTWNSELASKYELGSTLPIAFGGLSSSLRIGNFDASISFDYQIGGKIYDSRYSSLMTPTLSKNSGSAIHKDWIKSWTKDKPSKTVPRWQLGDNYTTSNSSRFYVSASYLNFQSFTLGYTLPKNLIRGISNVRVYVAGENLYFWSARKGLDPRNSFSDAGSLNRYSPVRNISAGLQLSF